MSLLEWKNRKIATTTGSTLASECASVKNLFGLLFWLRCCFLDALHAAWNPRVADGFQDSYEISCVGVTDCASTC